MSNNVSININNFNGPIELLLELIKEKQMDIFDIDLAELATAYVKLIEQLKFDNIDLASEYLVMAATLIQLKAKLLLNKPEDKVEVEKEKSDILKRLIEHAKYKDASKALREKEELRSKIFIREHSEYETFQKPIDETKLDGKSDAISLIIALRKMFERTNALRLKEATIETFNLSPAERRKEIISIFQNNPNAGFREIFDVPTINHFAITLLTVLDMSAKGELKLNQSEQYGDVVISKGEMHE